VLQKDFEVAETRAVISNKKEVEEALAKVLNARMDDLADEIHRRAVDNIIANGTSDSGFLMNSSFVDHSKFCEKQVVFPAGYASAVEYGTHPHYVSPYDLVGWTRRKLKAGDEALSIAFAISKKIEREGTPPQPFLMPAVYYMLGAGFK